MAKSLKKEFKYYLGNQEKLVEKYKGKYIVIKNKSVIGSYDSEQEAIEKTKEKHELGTFLVQICLSGSDNYTQTYNSRVSFQ